MVRVTAEARQQERTCVGCRTTDAPSALLRFVFSPSGDRLAPDIMRRLPGRGASVHPRRGCLEMAANRGGFARAFRRPVSVDANLLVSMAAEQYQRRAEGLLGAAQRSRKLVLGAGAIREELRRSSPGISALVVAEDAQNRRDEFWAQAGRLGRACVVFGNKQRLGALFGRPELAVVGVTDGKMASELARVVQCLADLSEGT
ncbi:MAG: DUF448 domain-containing protein [Myxococcota bacterium]